MFSLKWLQSLAGGWPFLALVLICENASGTDLFELRAGRTETSAGSY